MFAAQATGLLEYQGSSEAAANTYSGSFQIGLASLVLVAQLFFFTEWVVQDLPNCGTLCTVEIGDHPR